MHAALSSPPCPGDLLITVHEWWQLAWTEANSSHSCMNHQGVLLLYILLLWLNDFPRTPRAPMRSRWPRKVRAPWVPWRVGGEVMVWVGRECLLVWLGDWLACLVGWLGLACLVGWLIGWLGDWLACLVGGLIGWLVDWLVGFVWLVGGWVVGWLVGWVGLSVGRSVLFLFFVFFVCVCVMCLEGAVSVRLRQLC